MNIAKAKRVLLSNRFRSNTSFPEVKSEHFAWSDGFTLVIGLTPTGRTTVETLELNREGVVNLRRVLYAIGEHPPAEKF